MKCLLFAGLMLSLLSFALVSNTDRTITGTVKDEHGNAIIGASVIAKRTTNGVVTGVNGKFSIIIDDNTKALEISYVGYKTETVKLTANSDYTVVLKQQTSALNEVVVV